MTFYMTGIKNAWSFTQRRSYGDKEPTAKKRLFTVLLLQMDGQIIRNPLMQ